MDIIFLNKIHDGISEGWIYDGVFPDFDRLVGETEEIIAPWNIDQHKYMIGLRGVRLSAVSNITGKVATLGAGATDVQIINNNTLSYKPFVKFSSLPLSSPSDELVSVDEFSIFLELSIIISK